MTKKYFKVTLLSDIVVNKSLATEGNMSSLDYIPGSNFLGIAAKKVYDDDAYELFHAGMVSFGDAHILGNNEMSYHLPFSLFQDKLKNDIEKDPVYLHHVNIPDKITPKQVREGYFTPSGVYFKKPVKKFSLKSAQDPLTRRSEDEKMFGMESIVRGQEFIFSVIFKNDKYINKVSDALIGVKFLGKSKSAQYGKVDIQPIENPMTFESNINGDAKRLVLYAESNLCFLNDWGQATYRPDIKNFGLKNGTIRWDLSQIRTYRYSPWNGKRNTTSTQRDCISKGSVFVFDDVEFDTLPTMVGEYTAEGLGRVIWNPDFFDVDENNKWSFKWSDIKSDNDLEGKEGGPVTPIGKQLESIKKQQEKEIEMMKAIICFLNNKANMFKNITSSQWGELRSRAQAADSWDKLFDDLFSADEDNKKKGFLFKGVGAVKMWNKGGLNTKLKEYLASKHAFGIPFVIRLAAEMAKWKQRQKD